MFEILENPIVTATLVFLNKLDIYARIEEKLWNRISVWECEISSEASTAEIKPVVTKKDEFQYGDKFFLLARFDFFWKSGFFDSSSKKASFSRDYFSTRLWISTKFLKEQSPTVVKELYVMTYRYELEF